MGDYFVLNPKVNALVEKFSGQGKRVETDGGREVEGTLGGCYCPECVRQPRY